MHVETASTLLALLSYTKKNTATKRIAAPVAAGKIKEDNRMDMSFVAAGMVLTLFVLFVAEGICAAIRKE